MKSESPKITVPPLVPGEEATTGILSYSCSCTDGPGLIYSTDKNVTLVFDDSLTAPNPYSNFDDSMTTKYKDFLNVRTWLVYQNTGRERCAFSQVRNDCRLDTVVRIVSFTKY